MNLVSSGTHVTPTSQTHISVASTTNLNIPATSQSDQELSKNQLTEQYATAIVRLPAKHSASNSLWAKASNDKSPTIVTLIITVQPDGAGEQVAPLECLAPPDNIAPQSPSLTGSYEGIASVKPPLVMEIITRIPKFKSLIHQGALAKTEDLTNPVQETPTDRNEGAQTRQEMPKVHMEEIPDEEDDISFQIQKTKLIPPVAPEVTQSTVAESSDSGVKTEKVPSEWLKPFSAEWTLQGIIEARTESEAKAILKNWIHKAHVEEVIDEMIEGMQKSTRIKVLWWLKEL